MGYYIETKQPTGKAEQLMNEHGAETVRTPLSFDGVPADKALICVVMNGPFDAAALIYNDREFREFSLPTDPRPHSWLLMDKQLAHELAGYEGG